jgi:hypothetical protein
LNMKKRVSMIGVGDKNVNRGRHEHQ